MQTDQLEAIVDDAVTDRLEAIGEEACCSALQAEIWRAGEPVWSAARGRTRLDEEGEPVTAETPFDVASLTKPLITGTLLMQSVNHGLCGWSNRLEDLIGAWSDDPRAEKVNLGHLANHTSGLPDWRALYEDLPLDPGAEEVPRSQRAMLEAIAQTDLEAEPGERECYSDLGYILLGRVLEEIWSEPLEELAAHNIFEPLGLSEMQFSSAARGDDPIEGAAATEDDPMRDGVVCGRVHDRNTAAWGGVAGHAGLFATASDVARLADHLLAIAEDREPGPENPLVTPGTLRYAWSEEARGPDGHHLLGWDTPSGDPSSAGRPLQASDTVGHLGFTGTSLWIDRTRRLVVVLLTNRVYPSRDNDRIKPLRVALHEAAVAA